MKKSNIFVSIIIILIGIFTLIEVKSFPQGQNNVVGPGFFPGIIATILIILGIILFIQSIRIKKDEDKKVNLFNKENKLAYIIMGITLIYLVAMNYIGFLISSIIYLTTLIILYGENNKIKSLIASTIISSAIYFVFSMLLNVPLQ